MIRRISQTSRHRRFTAIAVVAGAVLTGCSTDGLAFRADHLIEINSPSAHEIVRLPFVVEFDLRSAGSDAASVGVFVDQNPPRAGRPIDPDADRTGIYLTQAKAVTVEHVLKPASGPASNRDRHELTVVLLDASGHRIGESAAWVEFTVAR